VIRHQAIGGDADPSLNMGLGENLLKRAVISGFVKHRESPDSAVQDVISEVSSNESRAA